MLYSVVSFLFCGYFIIVNLYLSNNIPSLLLYFILLLSTYIISKFEHLPNALLPMFVTLAGIVMFVNNVHPLNASFSILVTLSGITILANDVHP